MRNTTRGSMQSWARLSSSWNRQHCPWQSVWSFLYFSVKLSQLLGEHYSFLLNRQMWRYICSQSLQVTGYLQKGRPSKSKTAVNAITPFMYCWDVQASVWCLLISSKCAKLVTPFWSSCTGVQVLYPRVGSAQLTPEYSCDQILINNNSRCTHMGNFETIMF